MDPVKVEFTVEIPKGHQIEGQIRESLRDWKLNSLGIDSTSGRVVVESTHRWPDILEKIESTGLRAALTGFGGRAAVSIIDKGTANDSIKGVVRFTSPTAESNQLVVDGVVDGLSPDKFFNVQIHECGDVSKGCETVGDMYGARRLGATQADSQGRIAFRYSDDQFSISDLIGRSVVVTSSERDQQRLGCGIIARAAGISENFKRICACDGITLWDERNVPSAGGSRKDFAKK